MSFRSSFSGVFLASLSRAGLFSMEQAVFHGGTCLRIAFGMNRFSEALICSLKRPNSGFRWAPYLDRIQEDGVGQGLHFTVIDKGKEDTAVQKAFLRTDSFGAARLSNLPFERDARKLVKVKLEIDVNPPPGSCTDTRYINFPVIAAMTVQCLESGFAMKLSALLGRGYTKGRDWYDFVWYVNKKIVPDLGLLQDCLAQQGPWAGQKPRIDPEWLEKSLKKRISEIDWKTARMDVQRFLPLPEQEAMKLWERDFFLHHLGLFAESLRAVFSSSSGHHRSR